MCSVTHSAIASFGFADERKNNKMNSWSAIDVFGTLATLNRFQNLADGNLFELRLVLCLIE